MVRVKDKCPSCFQPITPTDFLCPHCELILDPTQAATRPVSEVSVVRRLLEIPQRGVPAERPDTKAARAAINKRDGSDGPTRVLNLGPELAGVPVVVATLTRKAQQLTELEAWVVSIIDGLSDAAALAKKAGLKELELRVLLRTLSEKQIIDFADEPLSDEDLDMPILGTLEGDVTVEAPGANADRRDSRFMAPPSSAATAKELTPVADLGLAVATGQPLPPTRNPGSPAPAFPFPPAPPPGTPAKGVAPAAEFPFPPAPKPAAPDFPFPPAPPPGTPARGVAPAPKPAAAPARPAAAPPFPFPPAPAPARAAPPPPPPPSPVVAGRAAPPPPPAPSPPAPIVTGRAEPPVLAPTSAPAKPFSRRADAGAAPPPYPQARPSREAAPAPPPPEELPRAERTDPRIAYQGNVNRKVLDALKKVKRADPVSAPSTSRAQEESSYADVLARDTLQVALRMEQGGRFEEAIRFLERSIAQSPDAPSLYNRLGIILMRERADYRRAEDLIRKATELAPDNSVYAANLRQVISQQALKRR